jgi:hypothetical protein
MNKYGRAGKPKEETAQKKKNGTKQTFRIFQAIFSGVFALGLSSMAGDLTGAWNLPFSSFSITTTMFGFIGMVICEIFARNIE